MRSAPQMKDYLLNPFFILLNLTIICIRRKLNTYHTKLQMCFFEIMVVQQ